MNAPSAVGALREGDEDCRLQPNPVGDETESAITSLKERVKAMRDLGVVKWADIELGPEPASASPEADATQRSLELERQETDRTRRLRYGASGGPRPADGDSSPRRTVA